MRAMSGSHSETVASMVVSMSIAKLPRLHSCKYTWRDKQKKREYSCTGVRVEPFGDEYLEVEHMLG